MNNFNFTNKELKIIRKLNTPEKIQDFLDNIPVNFENDGAGETCLSPKSVLYKNKAHCIEAAFFAAMCLKINNIGSGKALLVDMKGARGDWDHVVAVFRIEGKWGAISKTNHAVLRYREPVYESIRELVMSYFHEYTSDDEKGKKTLRSYSNPVDLCRVFGYDWMTSKEDLWEIHHFLDKLKHYNVLNKKQIKGLRRADRIEIELGKMREWCKTGKRNSWVIKNV